jgi:hypothetical protein
MAENQLVIVTVTKSYRNVAILAIAKITSPEVAENINCHSGFDVAICFVH